MDRQAVKIRVTRHRAEGDDGLLDGRRVSPCRGRGALNEVEANTVRSWIADTEGCGSLVFSRIG